VKRGLMIAVAAATVVAGVAGCSNGNNASGTSSSQTPSTATSSSATSNSPASTSSTPAAAGPAQVTIGGQPQNVSGPVVCATNNGKFSIAVGDMATGIIIGLEPDASVVHNAGLGTVNGVVMSFTEGVPDENATATKAGNTYKITGTASGTDNTGAQVHKPFEVSVTCP
jgi:lipoprotein LpqH